MTTTHRIGTIVLLTLIGMPVAPSVTPALLLLGWGIARRRVRRAQRRRSAAVTRAVPDLIDLVRLALDGFVGLSQRRCIFCLAAACTACRNAACNCAGSGWLHGGIWHGTGLRLYQWSWRLRIGAAIRAFTGGSGGFHGHRDHHGNARVLDAAVEIVGVPAD